MNIILTGGTGLIGSAMTLELVQRGHSVVLLSRSGKKSENRQIQIVPWDAENQGPWAAHISKADAIVNLAGSSIGAGRWTKS